MSSRRAPDASTAQPVVIRMSPMAHFASGFLALCLLVMITMFPTWGAVFMVLPVVASYAIVVDAKDDQGRTFYQSHGFIPLPSRPYRLFLLTETAASAIKAAAPSEIGRASYRERV